MNRRLIGALLLCIAVAVAPGTVHADPNDGFSDNFENESADSGAPDNWELTQGSSSQVEVTTTTAQAGSQSVKMDRGGGDPPQIRPTEMPWSSNTTTNFTFASNMTGTGRGIAFISGGGGTLQISNHDGNLEFKNENGSWTTLTTATTTNEWINVTVYDIDLSADTFSVTWDSPSDSGKNENIDLAADWTTGYDEISLKHQDGDHVFYDTVDVEPSGTSGGDPPYVKTADPSGDEYVNSSDRQISLDAKVKDPEGDPIDVTVYHNPLNGSGWLEVNSKTDVSSGSWVNTTVTADDGENRWKVKTDDDVNAAENSSVYEFRVGGLFTIFNGTDLTLANQTTISAEFTSQDSNFTTSKSTTDAKMELTGLPDETFEAELSGSGYANATIIVDDVTDPYFPILYESGAASTFSRCFELDDETGQYPPSESWIILEAYVDGDWEHVASDKFGAINNATITIQDGEDYRVKIKNEDGDIRSAGSFTADSSFSGCRTVTLQSPSDDGSGLDDADDETIDGDYEWDAYLDSQDDIFWYLHLGPNSTADSLNVTIWEHQNKSNELADLEFGERGLGSNTTHTEPLTSDQANNTWVVKWNGTINGEKQSGKRIVGKSEAALGSGFTTTSNKLPDWFKALVSIGSIFVVAGLFSQLNGGVGGLAVAGLGGMWFFIGWLPADVGAGVVVLAMIVAGAIYIRDKRAQSV